MTKKQFWEIKSNEDINLVTDEKVAKLDNITVTEPVDLDLLKTWWADLSNYYNKEEVDSLIPDISELSSNIDNKQDKLVSWTNIKTVNWQSLLWNWNIEIHWWEKEDSWLCCMGNGKMA